MKGGERRDIVAVQAHTAVTAYDWHPSSTTR